VPARGECDDREESGEGGHEPVCDTWYGPGRTVPPSRAQ
jgi:hypothetical protein